MNTLNLTAPEAADRLDQLAATEARHKRAVVFCMLARKHGGQVQVWSFGQWTPLTDIAEDLRGAQLTPEWQALDKARDLQRQQPAAQIAPLTVQNFIHIRRAELTALANA